jgi:hypothetical protein
MNHRRRALTLGVLACALQPGLIRAQGAAEGLPFSSLQPGAPLPRWLHPVTFRGRTPTAFTLVNDGGVTVLRAFAQVAASGLARELRIDPAAYRRVAWRWKVSNLVVKGDLRAREGDDFAARLYLRFGRRFGADRALCYVWDARAPVGTFAANAWSDRVHMVVVDSGPALLGRWVERERDYEADFRRAFGEAAPAVTAVVVSSDTDNTGESAEAFFGDVLFR